MDVFVVGCSRSGTTLVQSILAASPTHVSFPETNVLHRLFDDARYRRFGTLVGRRFVPKMLARRCRHWAGYTTCEPGPIFQEWLDRIGRSDLVRLVPSGSRSLREMFAAFEAILDELAAGEEWIEKTPQNVFCIEFLDRYFPDKAFVHVVRDAEANIASLLDAGSKHEPFASRFARPNGFARALEYWKRSVRASKRMRGRPRHVFLRYEDVAADPLTALKPVSDVTGIPLSEDMLVYDTDGISFDTELWKQRCDRRIRASTSKADRVLSPARRQRIAVETSRLMRAFPGRLPSQ